MGTFANRLEGSSLTPLHWFAILLAATSGLVHLVLGVGFLPHPMGVTFVLAAGGFFGAIVLVILDVRRQLLYFVGIPYTGVQIVLWYAVNQPGSVADLTTAGVVDKIAQALLIVALVVLYYRGT
ncbi:hypothetical protein ACFOZ7_01900 [Natribaculum luteum]|uniref:Uncharacterized protein n=1 Tax=Natribaculum luteum TaxID=1586232 RepID=A0ABD5NUR8_9EURY|nr:hypothetical protein [Natribaculum luteum]